MTIKSVCAQALMVAISVFALATPAEAEQVAKKFRVGVALGFFNPEDEVASDAVNRLILVDQQLQPAERYTDPRADSAAFGTLKIQPDAIGTIYGQYAVNNILVLEASVGYQQADVGDVEVQAQFRGVEIPEVEDFVFSAFRIPVGTLDRIPLQLTALARFRPRASFNPYVGGGIGYSIIGFEPAPEFDQLSQRLDASRGGQAQLSGDLFSPGSIAGPTPSQITDLSGATVDAGDTWEWHLAGGAELSFKRKWAVFVDLRYTFSARSLEIGFNNAEDLGVAVPARVEFIDSEFGSKVYGPVELVDGGLIDGGRLVPADDAPPNTDCAVSAGDCVFVNDPDGELDLGHYYVQGGQVEYGGFGAQVGVRFTF